MKSTLMMVMVALLVLVGLGMPVMAQSATSVVNVSITSCPATGNTWTASEWKVVANARGGMIISTTSVPSGGIFKITISNSDPAVKQSVEVWDSYEGNTLSSASARMIWSCDIGGIPAYDVTTTSTTVLVLADRPVQEIFGERYPLVFKNGFAIRKTLPGSTVRVAVQYK